MHLKMPLNNPPKIMKVAKVRRSSGINRNHTLIIGIPIDIVKELGLEAGTSLRIATDGIEIVLSRP